MWTAKSAQLAAALICFAALIGCEGVLNERVYIPEMAVECATAKCKQSSGAKSLYVYITQSDCQNPFWGSFIVGEGTVGCSAVSCVGEVSVWTQDNTVINTLKSGTYAVCAVIALEDPDVPGEPNYNRSGNAKFTTSAVVFTEELKEFGLTNWQDNL